MKRFIFILLFLPILALADTYPEVVFDNSLVSGSYARSKVKYTGQSWVENVNGHLLVSDTLFFTPGNALSLKYNSSAEGNWEVDIRYSRQKFLYKVSNSDVLTFRMYIHSASTDLKALPKIAINQKSSRTDSLNLGKYIVDYGIGKWVLVRIPCRDFKGLNNDESINGICLMQNIPSKISNHIFLDQIEFLPKSYSEVRLSSPAFLTSAEAYDKMVHLKWQLPLTPSIRYIKIYRSTDGQNYIPVGLKPIHMQSCLDYVPLIGKKYYYKITWVDYNYNESPFSTVRDVQTMEMDNAKLLSLVQLAHVNYFIENVDVNSGMYMPYRSKDKAVVSTKETGGAILSLIIGVEKGQISKQAVLGRVSKIVSFLTKAQNYHGIFPAYFDGRRGIPEYGTGEARYNVYDTASIIEALLIARQYFSSDDDKESELRSKITDLYDRIDWNKLTIKASSNILSKTIALDGGDFEKRGEAISGPNYAINTYMLAIGSPQHALPLSTYSQGVYHSYIPTGFLNTNDMDGARDTSDTTKRVVMAIKGGPVINTDTLVFKPIVDSVFRYGQQLILGDVKGSLMDLYRPFLTIRPQVVSDSIYQWDEILKSYVRFVKRRDNELGVGVNSSDIWGLYEDSSAENNFKINPAIGAGAIIVDKTCAEQSILTLYRRFGESLFTEYGFRSWLDLRDDDVSDEYLALNQSMLAVMIENARTGLFWNLYENIPELKSVRQRLFTKDVSSNN